MSLDDLEIQKHTKPILAELDRQKEKAAAFKAERDEARAKSCRCSDDEACTWMRERDEARAQLAARDRDYSGSATVAAMDSLRAQRDAAVEALARIHDHAANPTMQPMTTREVISVSAAALLRAKEGR